MSLKIRAHSCEFRRTMHLSGNLAVRAAAVLGKRYDWVNLGIAFGWTRQER
jgi:hypothetical protein